MASFHSPMSFYHSNCTSTSPSTRRHVHTPTSQRRSLVPRRHAQLEQLQTNFEYQPGMLLHDQPEASLRMQLDDQNSDEFDQEIDTSGTSYHSSTQSRSVTNLLQQQQGMLSDLIKQQKDILEKQDKFEAKINEVEAKINSSPSSSTSSNTSPASNKRQRLVTGALSVSKNDVFIRVYTCTIT